MTAALMLALAVGAAPDEYNLAWKLKEGDTFYLQGKVVLAQTVNAAGQAREQEMTTETVTRYKIKSIKPGATVVEMTYLSNKATAKGMPGADAANDKLKGVVLTATLDAKMEVAKLQGYDGILDALAGNNEQQRAVAKGLLPEAAVKQMFNETFSLGVFGVQKVGNTWKRAASVPVAGLGEVETTTTYKLDAVKDDSAAVKWTATGKFKAGDGTIPGVPLKVEKSDLTVDKLGGSYTFDLSTGRVRESKTQMEMGGTITFSANGKDIEVAIKQKLTQSATISDKNPIKD
jgi:hypothetical protein